MKPNRTKLFIAISSLALVIVLIIQVNWIFKTAKIKEELFNEKANMVLTRTSEALAADTVTCRNMETCIGKNEIRKIDSLFNYYMKFYSFRIDYSFEVLRPIVPFKLNNAYLNSHIPDSLQGNTNRLIHTLPPAEPGCYQKNLEEVVSKSGFELKLLFPKKEEYLIAEMGTPFITSIILILIVLVMFWRTTLSLMKEKQLSEHTTDFLNNMTHEFKTPLTNIALAGKMMTRDTNLGQEDKIKHYSGIILEENEKLRLQVEQVLSMTALERGEIPLQKTELDLHQLIHDTLKPIRVQIENKQGDLKLQLDAKNTVVFGDRNHLMNALCNLIDNAIKYSGEKPELFIQTADSAQHIVLVVSDKGIGIEKEYQIKVFDKFFRVPTGDVHDVKGFGLGLAYVKKIIEMHGGTIELQSEKEKGTTFIITLPHV
ncbi:MAG: two-component sensor histidine kinase [Bacteroidetes bacterium]|jgi:two-component system phosphate regulon sensor histidine kinase PhoR|nr:two-component sensor histidine kinase [Bacteroidota bacterium]